MLGEPRRTAFDVRIRVKFIITHFLSKEFLLNRTNKNLHKTEWVNKTFMLLVTTNHLALFLGGNLTVQEVEYSIFITTCQNRQTVRIDAVSHSNLKTHQMILSPVTLFKAKVITVWIFDTRPNK